MKRSAPESRLRWFYVPQWIGVWVRVGRRWIHVARTTKRLAAAFR